MIGVVCGIHGHARALAAVMVDGTWRGVTTWISLGSAVGLYADWPAVLGMLHGFAITLRGCHEENVVGTHAFIGSPTASKNAILQTRMDMPESTKRDIRAWPTETSLHGFHFRSGASMIAPAPGAIVIGTTLVFPPGPGFHYAGQNVYAAKAMDGLHPLPIAGSDYLFPGTVIRNCNGYRPAYLILTRDTVDFIRLPPFSIPEHVSNRSPAYLAM